MKHYVSREVAIKLKEIGFNEYCELGFITEVIEEEGVKSDELGYYANQIFIDIFEFSNTDFKSVTVLPEMYEVQDWFRDKNIIIDVRYLLDDELDYKYFAFVFNTNQIGFVHVFELQGYNNYYEALKAAILKAIEIYESIKREVPT